MSNSQDSRDASRSDYVRFVKNLIFYGLVLVMVYGLTRPQGGPKTGQAAPNFSGQLLSGERLDLESQKGRVVVIDFWATWCGPCRKSLPALQKVHTHYKTKSDVLIASVNIDSTRDYAHRVGSYMRNSGFDFPVVLDPGSQIALRYNVKTVPTLIVVDPQGNVSSVQQGLYSSNTDRLIEHIEEAIEEARSAQ